MINVDEFRRQTGSDGGSAIRSWGPDVHRFAESVFEFVCGFFKERVRRGRVSNSF